MSKNKEKGGFFMKHRSLQAVIMAIILPIIVVVLTVLSRMTYATAKTLTETAIWNGVTEGVEFASEQIDCELSQNREIAQANAKTVAAGYGVLTEPQYADLVTQSTDINAETFGGGIFFAPNAYQAGMLEFAPYCMRENGTMTYEGMYTLESGSYTNEEFYTCVANQKDTPFAWTAPYLDTYSGTSMITASAPIFSKDGVFLGVCTADMDLAQIQSIISNLQVNGKGRAFLVDTAGTYVGTQDTEKLLNSKIQEESNASLAQLGQKILQDTSGTGQYEDADGVHYVFYMPVDDSNLIIGMELTKKELYGDIATLRNAIIIICVFSMILLGVLLLVVLGHFVLKPLKKMESSVHRIAQGELNVEISGYADNEIGIIADSLKNLVHRLKSYIDYITEIAQVLNQIADGNLRFELVHDYVGEFAPVKDALLNISDNLNQTMHAISTASEQVASGADQVSSGAQALAQGATEQASAVEELASQLSSANEQVQHMDTNTHAAATRAEHVKQEMGESSKRMAELMDAMKRISDASSQIGRIIKTIEDIAFQTNILALNAAVEAARAGAAGKGFAVVADEVRNLASKSAEASQNTANLITAALDAVNDGIQLADGTSDSLQIVVDGIDQVNDALNEISTAAAKEAETIAEISNGIDQISSVVQTNSATAEQSSAASEEMSGQAQMLNEQVGKFTLSDI